MNDVMEMKRSNLILPMQGYELERDEMSYVEGGARIYSWTVAVAVDSLTIALGIGLFFAPIKLAGKIAGQKIVANFFANNAGTLASIGIKALEIIVGGTINFAVGKLMHAMVGAIWNFTSPGGIISFALDYVSDGVYDGIITI